MAAPWKAEFDTNDSTTRHRARRCRVPTEEARSMTNPQAPAPTTMPDRLLSNGRAMDEASFAIDAAPSAAKPLPTHGISASPDASSPLTTTTRSQRPALMRS